MAMRLFTKDEFDNHLSNELSLIDSGEATATTRIWRTESGRHILVPSLDDGALYPDYLLTEIYKQIELIESCS